MTTTTSGSVLQALGLGSGLDIETLAKTLTEAEMNAANNRVKRQQESVTSEVSAVASLKSSLAVFQAALLSLSTGSSYSSRSATSSNEELLKANASTNAVPGAYRVTVDQLASAQQLLSTEFAGGSSTVVGTGELTLSLGSSSFTVAIDSTNSTLAGIRDAINDAAGSSGLSATLIYGVDGAAQLLLSSSKTGEDNTISVSASGGDGGLSRLTYSSTNTVNYTEDQEAKDAIIHVAGVEHHSSTNKISGAIDGLTFDLIDSDPNITVSVKVLNDTSNMVSMVETFVAAYNNMNGQLASLGAYNATTQEAGPMLGDALYNNVQRQLGHVLRDTIGGADSVYDSLSSLGITTDASGKLVVNGDKLKAALDDDFEAATGVFQADGGVIARMGSFLDDVLSSNGLIAARDASLDRQQAQIDDQKDLIEMRTQQVQARFLAKFNAMDSMLAQLHSTSDYLTQTFDALTRNTK